MEGSGLVLQAEHRNHAVVIPLFGELTLGLLDYLQGFTKEGFLLVLVDNNLRSLSKPLNRLKPAGLVVNRNQGGIAGGLNRGINWAYQIGAYWITLLDQDSRIPIDQLHRLREPWEIYPQRRLIVGPRIWDDQRGEHHGSRHSSHQEFQETRLLISSGTTFRSADWHALGGMHEGLSIDFVDHAWCFRAQLRGFRLLQHEEVRLEQQFGERHPNGLCHGLGLQLYSPERHYFGLRNLRWLCLQPYIPLDLKLKEVLKMLVKPWLWLLFEPKRRQNFKAIWSALVAPLPGNY